MCDFLLGDWKLDTSDNFENLMKELGVGFVLRKIGNTTKPNIKFEKDGDEWTQTTTSAIKTHQIKFKFDEEFKEETLDGRKCLSTCSVVDGKFVHTQKDEKTGKVQLVTTRELESPGVVKAVSSSFIQITLFKSMVISIGRNLLFLRLPKLETLFQFACTRQQNKPDICFDLFNISSLISFLVPLLL